MRAPTILLVAAIAASFPSVAPAQARITRIVGPDGSAVSSTSDVERIPFGSVRPSEVTVDTVLGIGDELRAKHGKIVVVLSCSDTATVTLQGEFRVVIMPRPGQACFLDLFAGAAHVMGDTSTGLGLGDVTMGAKRTHYSVTVSRFADGVRRELDVFEGEVEVRSAFDSRPIEVRTGTTLTVALGGYERSRITPRQIDAAAGLYSVVDASTVKQDVRPTVVRNLYTTYQRVLTHPDSAAARLDLISKQVKYEATSKTTLYQIERVRATAPRTSQLDATTAALSVAAYTQLGEEQKAAARYEALRSYDEQTVQNALRAYRIDPEMIRRAGRFDARGARVVQPGEFRAVPMTRDTLRVRAASDPQTIKQGERSRIVVKVTTSAGAPVEGATVRISTGGGGTFAGGRVAAEGLTSADGSFSVVWSCTMCAPSHVLAVEVAKEGFVSARARAGVRVQ